jgi:methylenetetrahydrofolate--tRNA-(uracil-5-)-methyltransferase
VTAIDESREVTIIATGPLTSDGLASEIARLSKDAQNSASQWAGTPAPHGPHLYFYDSISPIVEADSIDVSRVYRAARYDKGSADYINCPMTPEEYLRFYDALLAAQSVEDRDWEKLNTLKVACRLRRLPGADGTRFASVR